MKLIVFKKDIAKFLADFNRISSFDEKGNKEYFVFADAKRNGQWTLMHYRDENKWTIHGKGENYCDEGETVLTETELVNFLYRNRKYVNNTLRQLIVS